MLEPRTAASGGTSQLHRYALLAWLLIAFSGMLVLVAPSDYDLWWHLRSGELVAASGVPLSDPFSYPAYGRVWIDHEWLVQWSMYHLNRLFGYTGPMLLFGLIQAGTMMLVYRLLREHDAGRRPALFLLLCFFLLATPTWGVRPQILAPLFLAAFSLVLSRQHRDPQHYPSLCLLPPLSWLWANLHGSFMLGIALIAIYLTGAALENLLQRRTPPRRLRPLALALLASLTLTLVNPYGVQLWLLPLSYLSVGGGDVLNFIDEWRSPDFHNPQTLILPLCLLPLLLFGIGRAEGGPTRYQRFERIDVTATLLVTAFTLMGLRALYHFPLFGVIVLPVVAGHLARNFPAWSRHNDEPVADAEARFNLIAMLSCVALLALLLLHLPQSQTAPGPRLDGKFQYPEGATRYLAGLPSESRLFNDFGWGGFLIYKLYPQQHVFIDGRFDIYRHEVLEDYLQIQQLMPGWRSVMNKYGINIVLIRTGTPLDEALHGESGWRTGYRDDLAVVYQRP